MKILEIREKTDAELSEKVVEICSEMMNLRFQATKGVLENPARLRFLRRGIARINTVLTQRKKEEKTVESKNG